MGMEIEMKWYECDICKILIQDLYKFLLHKDKHEGKQREPLMDLFDTDNG